MSTVRRLLGAFAVLLIVNAGFQVLPTGSFPIDRDADIPAVGDSSSIPTVGSSSRLDFVFSGIPAYYSTAKPQVQNASVEPAASVEPTASVKPTASDSTNCDPDDPSAWKFFSCNRCSLNRYASLLSRSVTIITTYWVVAEYTWVTHYDDHNAYVKHYAISVMGVMLFGLFETWSTASRYTDAIMLFAQISSLLWQTVSSVEFHYSLRNFFSDINEFERNWLNVRTNRNIMYHLISWGLSFIITFVIETIVLNGSQISNNHANVIHFRIFNVLLDGKELLYFFLPGSILYIVNIYLLVIDNQYISEKTTGVASHIFTKDIIIEHNIRRNMFLLMSTQILLDIATSIEYVKKFCWIYQGIQFLKNIYGILLYFILVRRSVCVHYNIQSSRLNFFKQLFKF